MFATKPQLADGLLERAQSRGIRAAFVAGDEVYGGRELRRGIRRREMGYVMAVRANHALMVGSGQIGRAACRGRVEISGGAVSLKKKKKRRREARWKASAR